MIFDKDVLEFLAQLVEHTSFNIASADLEEVFERISRAKIQLAKALSEISFTE